MTPELKHHSDNDAWGLGHVAFRSGLLRQIINAMIKAIGTRWIAETCALEEWKFTLARLAVFADANDVNQWIQCVRHGYLAFIRGVNSLSPLLDCCTCYLRSTD